MSMKKDCSLEALPASSEIISFHRGVDSLAVKSDPMFSY